MSFKIHKKPVVKKKQLAIRETQRKPLQGGWDGLSEPENNPLQTAQLIGALVIRFVMYAQSGLNWQSFPDRQLLEAILEKCSDREAAEQDLTALLFHHSKILDNCGQPIIQQVRRLAIEAFPKAKIEAPEWEMLEPK